MSEAETDFAGRMNHMLNEASLDQLIAWSAEPGLLPRVPTGPDRGKGWDQVSASALSELTASRDADLRFSAQTELERRNGRIEVDREPTQARLL